MFTYRNDLLHCEDVSLNEIAAAYGTPVYVYSANTIRRRIAILKETFSELSDLTLSFAVKVNNNLGILRLMAEEGIGADIISCGELYRYLQAGGDHTKVMFAGVAKTEEEIAYAIDHKIAMFNAESIPEMVRINTIAEQKNTIVNVACRINPDVEAGTHDKITTGKRGVKFGISVATLKANLALIKSLKNIKFMGVDIHIGSQITDPEPFIEAYKVVARVIEDLRATGFDITVADLGGGIGIPYDKTKGGFSFERYRKEAIPVLKSMNVKIVAEPGRFLVGESAALLMNTEYIKEEWDKTFVIVNGGMNDYIRVALYDAYNDILPITRREGSMLADIVGPVCESSDFFAKGRELTPVKAGDKIALMDAGGYGMSMASNYNARPFIAEVLVDGAKTKLIRRRQTIEELILHETGLEL